MEMEANDLCTHRTSSQAVPFGKTSSQLTRTVDKSIRSVSGAPFDSKIIFTSILPTLFPQNIHVKEFVIMVQIVICTHERIDVGLPAEGEGRAGEVEEQGQDL